VRTKYYEDMMIRVKS